MRLTLTLILLSLFLRAGASNKVLEIGLFWGEEPTEITVQTGEGSYSILGNGKELTQLNGGTILRVKNVNGLLHIRTLSEDLGTYYSLEINRNVWGSSLKIQRKGHKVAHEFYDNFSIFCWTLIFSFCWILDISFNFFWYC